MYSCSEWSGQVDLVRPHSISSNGSADPNLGFHLGLPTEFHQHPQHHQHEHVFLPKSPMSSGRKSPSQRRRDRLRAAQHQAAAPSPPKAVTTPVGKYRRYIDVNYANKNFFTTVLKPPLLSQEHQKQSYQKNEAKLWTKLFK